MPAPEACPRCQYTGPGEVSCPRCGVVFAKLRPEAAPRRAAAAVPPAPRGGSLKPLLVLVGGLAAILGGFRLLRPEPTTLVPAAVVPDRPQAARVAVAADVPPPTLAPRAPLLPPLVSPSRDVMDEADRESADRLKSRIEGGGGLDAGDLRVAEDLAGRHPQEPALNDLLAAALTVRASQERSRRRFREAAALLERAAALRPQDARPWLALLHVHLEAGDWAAAEAAARSSLRLEPRNLDALKGLGYALLRQDRSKEAAEALQAALEVRADSDAEALLARVRKGMADESGLVEQQLSHFHVRYDGAEHADVGREILRALERHYVTLTAALDHRPAQAIPVILFSSQAYYDASGAPSWSGGNYDLLDGRVRIPIGGLTPGLTPDLDGTLVHELTHAFVADLTRGAAPRDLHEGLAQYMEGKRVVEQLTADQLTALADGRIRGVVGFYLRALSFAEYLVAQRGMGGMGELLRAMGETGNVDEGFQRVYGQGYGATQRAWLQRLAQQHGS